jgi:hypothetical protein
MRVDLNRPRQASRATARERNDEALEQRPVARSSNLKQQSSRHTCVVVNRLMTNR